MNRRRFLRTSLSALAAITAAGASEAALSLPEGLATERSVPNRATRRILYVLGQFSQATPQAMHNVVETIGNSTFNVVILSFLQASLNKGNLELLYNGNSFPLAQQVPGLLTRLHSGFAARKRIMVSIGGWQQLATFKAIQTFGVPAFIQRLTQEVVGPLHLDGIDLDLEPQTGGFENWIAVHREYGKTLVDLTNEYKRVYPDHVVTHAPPSILAAQLYATAAPLPGISNGLLAATRTLDGNNIDWLNVQFYEGGIVAGGDIAGFYRNSLAGPLTKMKIQIGIANPLHFFTPLFQPEAKQPPEFCRQTIEAIDRRCADLNAGVLNGVAVWDYRQIAPSIDNWSRGLEVAVGI